MTRIDEIKNKQYDPIQVFLVGMDVDMKWLIEKLEKAIDVIEEFSGLVEKMHSDGRLKDANTFMFKERSKEFLKELE